LNLTGNGTTNKNMMIARNRGRMLKIVLGRLAALCPQRKVLLMKPPGI
jgi:hypothetical protein